MGIAEFIQSTVEGLHQYYGPIAIRRLLDGEKCLSPKTEAKLGHK